MTSAAKSLIVFSGYLALVGLVLLLAPNLLLQLFGFPPTEEVWIRLVGMLLLYLAYYYYEAARGEWTGFIRATVPARCSVILFLAAFVALGYVSPALLLFGVVDLASGVWTLRALRRERVAVLA